MTVDEQCWTEHEDSGPKIGQVLSRRISYCLRYFVEPFAAVSRRMLCWMFCRAITQ